MSSTALRRRFAASANQAPAKMARLIGRYVLVALLVAGSAILLFSCDKPPAAASGGDEALMTEYSEHLSVIMSENGRRSYFFKGAAARRIYAGQGAVPRVPQGDRDHHLPGRLADDGRRRADGQLRDLLREPETVGGQGRRGGRQVRRQDALHPAALLERQDAAHLFERRYEDRPERRRQRLSGRGLRVGRSLQGVAFPPLHGENGCRCEPGGRRTVRIGSCRRGRPAGRRKDAAVRDPPACRFRTCACRCGRTRPCRLGREGTDRCRTRAGA